MNRRLNLKVKLLISGLKKFHGAETARKPRNERAQAREGVGTEQEGAAEMADREQMSPSPGSH